LAPSAYAAAVSVPMCEASLPPSLRRVLRGPPSASCSRGRRMWRFGGAPRHGIGWGSAVGEEPDAAVAACATSPPPRSLSPPSRPPLRACPRPFATSGQKRRAAVYTEQAPDAATPTNGQQEVRRALSEDLRAAARRRIAQTAAQVAESPEGVAGWPPPPVVAAAAAPAAEGPRGDVGGGRDLAASAAPTAGALPAGGLAFAVEVRRITCAGRAARDILGLLPSQLGDLQAIQSKYRQLMRLLHPDKRRADDEANAGGRELCDEAVSLVQQALEDAKRDAASWLRREAQQQEVHSNPLHRVQEVQRQQARSAMHRQQRPQSASLRSARSPSGVMPVDEPKSNVLPEAKDDVGSLIADIAQVLGPAGHGSESISSPATTTDPRRVVLGVGGGESLPTRATATDPRRAAIPPPRCESTSAGGMTSQIVDLLAQLRKDPGAQPLP